MSADPRPRPALPGRGLIGAASIALAVAALYYGRDVLVPLALAGLLAFLLDPLVQRLRRLGLPRVVAIALVVTGAVGVVGGGAVFVGAQLVDLSRGLPTYQETIRQKLAALRRGMTTGHVLDDAARVLGVVEGEVDAARHALEPRAAKAPVRVQVEPAPPSPLRALAELLSPLLAPVMAAGAVLVFLVFMLVERAQLRDRVLRLAGADLRRSTDALDDAARRVTRYLAMQLLLNLAYGVPIGVGLALIGVPGAPLWGLLAAVLRFVPYAGPVIAAAFPVALAFAVDPGWSMLLWTLALVVVVELVSNQLLEPWLYGSSTGITPLALLVSAAFWAALWGPVGLVLATPLTVCLVVMGRHLRPLRIFDVLFGSEPVFDAPTRLYQRLLAGDAEEAIELAGEQIRGATVQDFYADTALPALRLSSLEHGRLDARLRHRLAGGFATLLQDLREDHPAPAAAGRPAVVCIGLRWEADTLAAGMMAHALELAGRPALALPAAAVGAGHIAALDLEGVDVVCLSCFNPEPEVHARYVCRRLRRRRPQLRIVVALWNTSAAVDAATLEADAVATTLPEALAQAGIDLAPRAGEPAPSAARLQAQAACAALDADYDGRVAATLQRAADVFDAALTAALTADGRRRLHGGGAGAEALLNHLLDRTLATGVAFQTADLTLDPALPTTAAGALRFAAAAPMLRDGVAFGMLCVADPETRALSPAELQLLQTLADGAAAASPAVPA